MSLVLVVVAVVSCAEKLIEKPENLIPEAKMTDILYDISLLVSAKNSNKAILVDNGIEVMDFIYKKYNVDSLQFVQSDLYYASEPVIYENMYVALDERIEAEKNKRLEERKMKTDSTIEANKKKAQKNTPAKPKENKEIKDNIAKE